MLPSKFPRKLPEAVCSTVELNNLHNFTNTKTQLQTSGHNFTPQIFKINPEPPGAGHFGPLMIESASEILPTFLAPSSLRLSPQIDF
jgi:hypothetical protein